MGDHSIFDGGRGGEAGENAKKNIAQEKISSNTFFICAYEI
jgi:hypothetical protein